MNRRQKAIELLKKAVNWLELPDGGCDNIQTCDHDNDECPVWCINQALAALEESEPKSRLRREQTEESLGDKVHRIFAKQKEKKSEPVEPSEFTKKFDEYQVVIHSLARYLRRKRCLTGTGYTCDDIKQGIFDIIDRQQGRLAENQDLIDRQEDALAHYDQIIKGLDELTDRQVNEIKELKECKAVARPEPIE